MLGVCFRGHNDNETLRQMCCKDVVLTTGESEVRWARHFIRLADNRWTLHVIEWYLLG